MFRVISHFSIFAIGVALSAATAFADDLPEQEQLMDQGATEVVFVSESAPEVVAQPQSEFDQRVAAMVESEQLLNLTARLSPVAPQS